MKSRIYKLVSLFMAIMVLSSTISFALNLHYCGDTLVDFSVRHDTATCGMEQQSNPVSCTAEKPLGSCCTDKSIVKDGQDDLKPTPASFTLEQTLVFGAFVYSYINLFEDIDRDFEPFIDYSPPFIERDVQILYETYLI